MKPVHLLLPSISSFFFLSTVLSFSVFLVQCRRQLNSSPSCLCLQVSAIIERKKEFKAHSRHFLPEVKRREETLFPFIFSLACVFMKTVLFTFRLSILMVILICLPPFLFKRSSSHDDCFLLSLFKYTEPSIRAELAEQLPQIACFCLNPLNGVPSSMSTITLPILEQFLADSNSQVCTKRLWLRTSQVFSRRTSNNYILVDYRSLCLVRITDDVLSS